MRFAFLASTNHLFFSASLIWYSSQKGSGENQAVLTVSLAAVSASTNSAILISLLAFSSESVST